MTTAKMKGERYENGVDVKKKLNNKKYILDRRFRKW